MRFRHCTERASVHGDNTEAKQNTRFIPNNEFFATLKWANFYISASVSSVQKNVRYCTGTISNTKSRITLLERSLRPIAVVGMATAQY